MHPGAIKVPKDEYAKIKRGILGSVSAVGNAIVQGLLQYGNNVPLSQRLKELVGACSEKVLNLFIPNAETFVKEVLDSRNYYTHYTMSDKKHVKQGQEQMILTKRMQVVLVINLLMYLGFSMELVHRLYKNQEFKLMCLLN